MVSKQDLEKLASVSDMAKLFTNNERCEIVDIVDLGVMHEPEFSFHPNGKCGCIELIDDNMFGIRCNHLMWAEGSCEGVEHCFKNYETELEDDEYYPDDPYFKTIENTILLYGNHKGMLRMYLLFYNF